MCHLSYALTYLAPCIYNVRVATRNSTSFLSVIVLNHHPSHQASLFSYPIHTRTIMSTLRLDANFSHSHDVQTDPPKVLEILCTPFIQYMHLITKIKTLEEFTFHNPTKANDMPEINALLTLLVNNPLLKKVVILSPSVAMPVVTWPLNVSIKLPRLKYLSLKLNGWKEAKYMISRIPIMIPEMEGIEVKIYCDKSSMGLDEVFESVGGFASSLTSMTMNYPGSAITWSGKKGGRLSLSRVSDKDMCSALTGRCKYLSCKNIENLELMFGSSSPELEPTASLFPAIQTVTAYRWAHQYIDPSEGLRKFLQSVGMVTEERGEYAPTDKRVIWRKLSVQE